MISVTGYKKFKKCRRQWFYATVAADSRVKNDAFRREVTLLSKLLTVSAWRGTIVDNVLSKYLVTAINNKYPIKKDYFIGQAMDIFDKQLDYAVNKRYREPGAILTNNPDFNGLIEYELDQGVSSGEINAAREDILNALTNVLDNAEFMEYLKSSKRVISQRNLVYNFDRFSVSAKPDLIAFFEDKPPHIFDWKVHTFGTATYDEQLIAYAIALFKVSLLKPHDDFPEGLSKHKIYDYKLSEYQLLHPERIKRDYEVTPEKVDEFGDTLATALIEMHMAGANKTYKQLEAKNFSTAEYVETCQNCPFKKICKDGNHEIRNKHEIRSKHLQD